MSASEQTIQDKARMVASKAIEFSRIAEDAIDYDKGVDELHTSFVGVLREELEKANKEGPHREKITILSGVRIISVNFFIKLYRDAEGK